MGIDLDDEDQAVELAVELPDEGAAQAPRSGSASGAAAPAGTAGRPRQNSTSGNADVAAARIGQPRTRRRGIDTRPADTARTPAGRGHTARPRTGGRRTAPGRTASKRQAAAPVLRSRSADPRRQRPQRKPDAEHVVHRADEEDVVVEQRERDQRQHRPVAVKLAIERERARQDQHEACDRVDLPGEIDVHHPLEHRHHEVHHQVRNDLPVDLVEAGEIGIGADRRR